MKFPLGEMTVGDILDRGIKLLFARLPTFYLINLLVLWPAILVQVAAPLVFQNDNPMDPKAVYATVGVALVCALLALMLYPLGTAAILHIIMEEYVGNRVSIGQAFSFALTRFLPLIGASILVGIIVALGFICCIPGWYFWTIYAFVAQIVVLEHLGVTEAMQRSSNLVKGYRWRVFGVLILILFANFIIQLALGSGLQLAMPAQEIIPVKNGLRTKFNPVNHVVVTLITQLLSIVFTTYIEVCTTLLYLDLRIRKEGFDLELAGLGDEEDVARMKRKRERNDFDDDFDDRRRDDRDDDLDPRDDRKR